MRTAALPVFDGKRVPAGEISITEEQVREAIGQYDVEYPLNDYPRSDEKPHIKTWFEHARYKHAIRYQRRCCPPKLILWYAIGRGSKAKYRFMGGPTTNGVLRRLGFEVVDKSLCR